MAPAPTRTLAADHGPPPAPAPPLAAVGLTKRYGGILALDRASIEVRRGEVLGLLGENGSGKSTLLKLLSGQVQPDGGTILLDGEERRFADPTAALAAGIATVTQETTLVPELSIAENVLLGRRLVRRRGGIDWSASHRRAGELLERLELDVDPRRELRTLAPDQQQMVEIARAISMDARVLILDEPTSSLTDDEVSSLFAITRRLAGEGVGIVFVSHRMAEVFQLVDRVAVLRDGVAVGGGPIGAFDEPRLIHLMVGKELDAYAPTARVTAEPEPGDAPLLRATGLTLPGRLDGVSLSARRGQIVGLAGLLGAGRSELLGGLFGLEPELSGRIELDGRAIAPDSPRAAMREGIAYVPADRKRLGLAFDMNVPQNLLMAETATVARLRVPPHRSETATATQRIADLGIVAKDPRAAVGTLSGGNQQKVLLGKWLGTAPRLLLLDEPTRGVDVGAKADIYRLLTDARDRGLAVVVSSSEVPELLLLCDTILVLFGGRVVGELSAAGATEAQIAHLSAGGS